MSPNPEDFSQTTLTSEKTSFDEPRQPVTVPCLFNDAALYRKVLAETPDGEEHISPPPVQNPALRSVQDFAQLVGDDLQPLEQDVVGRFAQLAAENWDIQEGDREEGAVLTEEPATLTDDERKKLTGSLEELGLDQPSSKKPAIPAEGTQLSPEYVLALLIEEFGSLAPEGEEKLILEADGAVIQDVVILGVIHVTTHRIAFHASLPAFDPTQPSEGVIRVGPALVHRKGWHRRRRIWLELSNDFICGFPSAREEDRIRPLRSLMLSSIVEVLPEDPKEPRALRTRLDGKSEISASYLEFDTLESAREWRRELQAAIFFVKRRKRSMFSHSDSEDIEGVRVNIPLHHIRTQRHRIHAALPVLSLTIDSPPAASNDEDSHQVIDLASFRLTEECVKRLESLTRQARERAKEDTAIFIERPVVIDLGVVDKRSESKSSVEDMTKAKTKEQEVCDVLAIDNGPDVWVSRASVAYTITTSGYVVISPQWLGFWSKSLASRDVRYRLPTATIRTANPIDFPIRGVPVNGVQFEIEGHSNLGFRFRSQSARDEAIRRVSEIISRRSRTPSLLSATLPISASTTGTNDTSLSDSRPPPTTSPRIGETTRSQSSILSPLSRQFKDARKRIDQRKMLEFPKAINAPPGQLVRMPSKHFVCLTIGSRGDVQPYIALGLGLKAEGHRVTIITHDEYKAWIEGFGLQHRAAGGDPGALMQLSVENKMFSPQFFKTSLSNYRTWLDHLLLDSWEHCSDADALLESPYAIAGVHIAEALHIPYFRVCTMPWTKTTEFPHPFISGPVETPTFNSMSFVLFDNIFWAATSSQVNRWRKESLHLEPTVMSHTAQSKIPILYNFSLAVVPKPLDWSDGKIICGYWFLDNPDLEWTPPESLLAFMKQARADGKPLVYIGFGSITVPDPHTMTEHIYQAVQKSDVRAILSKGWSGRMHKQTVPELAVPKECYVVDKIPHDWLFPQIDAAIHHGGAGTTGASLRAGIPTFIKPWFGDQFFWASRVQRLGAGHRVPSLRVNDLVTALKKATTDRIMKEKANIVGQKIRSEDGVATAIHYIYTYFPRAYSDGLSPQ
ncbi:glycosyltransferase family 1 protein [Phanerochaete carnosa HHB-10118-sp]|uniref:sterol 3beta-glucosyltransferase n=1 Tax=Phanerochaete carnosa (strain HHB-10118-sp) TaxID=650164 RepID=K5VJN9_PHACS|nr:glycosyltransferase family 1 protein [Phanerochaete carnosa HHB-10118-sp]EKM51568.1 glycosyltransferase family 1 protein [Phanerochaete carnosa HHB-10118-sp]